MALLLQSSMSNNQSIKPRNVLNSGCESVIRIRKKKKEKSTNYLKKNVATIAAGSVVLTIK